MALYNLLTWNVTTNPLLEGFRVDDLSTATSYIVKSGMFLDTTSYADAEAAAAIEYAVTAQLTAQLPAEDAEYPTFVDPTIKISRWLVPTTIRLCKLSGALRSPAGTTLRRQRLRIYPYCKDLPLARTDFSFFAAGELSVHLNCFGEFEAWLVAGVPMVLHSPDGEFVVRFVVPDAASADLQDLTLEPVPQLRNN